MNGEKYSLADIKKAIQWIEANTITEHVEVIFEDGKLLMKCFDKNDDPVTIVLFNGRQNMLAKKVTTSKL